MRFVGRGRRALQRVREGAGGSPSADRAPSYPATHRARSHGRPLGEPARTAGATVLGDGGAQGGRRATTIDDWVQGDDTWPGQRAAPPTAVAAARAVPRLAAALSVRDLARSGGCSMTDEVITCRKFVDLVTDYLEGELPELTLVGVEQHLVRCGSCEIYLEQVQATLTALRALRTPGPRAEPPEPLLEALRARRSARADR